MKTFLSQLDWRFATKSFDKEKKVSTDDLNKILEAIRKAPTSFGLQTFHVEVISNESLREKMKEVSFGQPQVTDASHLLVFCGRNDVSDRITDMINKISGGDENIKASLAGYEGMMRGSIEGKSEEQLMNWASRQAYLALGFGLAACAELEIDSCPMEGFDPKAVHELLGSPKNIFPFAYMAVGYRKEGPTHLKFRFPEEDLFTKRD
jgi:nitroreductase